MIPIFICETDSNQRNQIRQIVEDYMTLENLKMSVMVTENPYQLIEILKDDPTQIGIYFLDVDLNKKMGGITLASNIRKRDTQGVVILMATEMSSEIIDQTFSHKLEVMDIIVKDSPTMSQQICDCLQIASKRVLQRANN